MEITILLIVGMLAALFAVLIVGRSVRIVPQARACNVERLGCYRRTLRSGLNVVSPFIDRVRPAIDLREQVKSLDRRSVTTADNLVVQIDIVIYFQVIDPRSAAYEVVDYLQAVEQLTATTLRNLVGFMSFNEMLTSRESINRELRAVLDDATSKWGVRVNRVELKAIDAPRFVKDAMEKEMRAEQGKRAAILAAEGDKQGAVLRAEGERAAAILKAEGKSRAIDEVFQALRRNDPDLQSWLTFSQLAQANATTFWVIPGEGTTTLRRVSPTSADTASTSAARDNSTQTATPDNADAKRNDRRCF